MTTKTTETYEVTVSLEGARPDGLWDAPHWVARDASGVWRTFAAKHFAESAAAAVAQMFHANEVASVTDNGDTATATINS